MNEVLDHYYIYIRHAFLLCVETQSAIQECMHGDETTCSMAQIIAKSVSIVTNYLKKHILLLLYFDIRIYLNRNNIFIMNIYIHIVIRMYVQVSVL